MMTCWTCNVSVCAYAWSADWENERLWAPLCPDRHMRMSREVLGLKSEP